MAEDEIGTFHDTPRAEPSEEDLVEEHTGVELEEVFVRRVDYDCIDPQLGQQLRLLFDPAEWGWSPIGVQNPSRGRIEREGHRRPLQALCHGQQPLDNPLVPQMHAVKLPNRQSAVA